MFSHTATKINIVLLALALFAGQAAAQIHSAKHPFHKAEQSCLTFSALTETGNALTAGEVTVSHPVFGRRFVRQTVPIQPVYRFQRAYCARAPPSFT